MNETYEYESVDEYAALRLKDQLPLHLDIQASNYKVVLQ